MNYTEKTKPIDTLLPPDIQPEVKELLSVWSSKIDEVAAYGTIILDWVGLSGKLKGDEEVPVLMSFRNSLELIDAISILVRNSSIDPAKLQLRAILETIFVIKYITVNDSTQRSYNYLTGHYMRKRKLYQKLDSHSQHGKQFRTIIKRDKLASKMSLPAIKDLQARIDNIDKILAKPEYSNSISEYNRLKAAGNSNPNWYSYFGGPKNIIGLADHLDLPAMYEILYRQFSNNVHGQDIIDQKLSSGQPGETLIRQIRAPHEAQFVVQLTITLALYPGFK